MFDNRYDVTSNRESAKGCSDTALDELAQNALQQINDRKYDTEMLKHGVAFCGKKGQHGNRKYNRITSSCGKSINFAGIQKGIRF